MTNPQSPITNPQSLITTPRNDHFYMPGEFAPHERCLMLWPERPDVWRENGRPAQEAFAAVASAISQFEPVTMGVSAAQYPIARALLPPAVELVEMAYNDAWVRDNGPTMVVNAEGERRGIDWDFNAWGGLYQDWMDDDALAAKWLAHWGFGRYKAPLVMEGGAIDVDGVTVQWVQDRVFGLETVRMSATAQARIHKFVESVLKESGSSRVA
ncbi:MAG: agmatine deiminase family protein [Chloroflexi bacterium]|nr:agmatine deiminase family protein [Chloroflexota bacterium]